MYDWIDSGFVGITVSCCRRLRDGDFVEGLSHRHPWLGSNPSPLAVPYRITRILDMNMLEHVSLTGILDLDQVGVLGYFHILSRSLWR
jgi:hypothetical protein